MILICGLNRLGEVDPITDPIIVPIALADITKSLVRSLITLEVKRPIRLIHENTKRLINLQLLALKRWLKRKKPV